MKSPIFYILALDVILSLFCRSSAFVPTFPKSQTFPFFSLLDSPESVVEGVESCWPSREDDPLDSIRYLTEVAVDFCGEEKGLEALRALATLSKLRLPYDFESQHLQDGSVVSPFRQLLSPNTTTAFLEQVKQMEASGWLSTNPDSVDGLPSLHLNLVSQEQPLVSIDLPPEELDDFQRGIQKLLKIIQPAIYNNLLPEVNKLLNSTSARISDVFLRRYGQDICSNMTRTGISAHYDVYSRVTAVIAMDDVAAEGKNGLYTTHLSRRETKISSGKTSNHAALRRFFPLNRGDGVVHSWDVLHGVDVEPGVDRTSLIVWFVEGDSNSVISPWLMCHPEIKTNDVAQFVLGSALSSLDESGLDPKTLNMVGEENSEHRLYLQSAAHGNTFALTRMGSLMEEDCLNQELINESVHVLEELRPFSKLPEPIKKLDTPVGIAARFWLEGAVRGNPLAQRALADELMLEASTSGDTDARVLAATLFALAAQQGIDEASESLSRVAEFDLAGRGIKTEEEFLASPVVRLAKAALS